MGEYLVVAHETAGSPQLVEELRATLQRDSQAKFVLLVPATPVSHLLTWEEGETSEVASRRAQEAFGFLTRAGLPIARTVVGASSPLLAIEQEVRSHPGFYEAIIISTHPSGLSRWLRMDVVHQAARRTGLPVIHVESKVAASRRAPAGLAHSSAECQHERADPFWDDEFGFAYRCAVCGKVFSREDVADWKLWRP